MAIVLGLLKWNVLILFVNGRFWVVLLELAVDLFGHTCTNSLHKMGCLWNDKLTIYLLFCWWKT